ncbi:hypothetical protein BIY24_10800 [Halobacteriovorax marinus]|uniref:hypothetical protein n=1 Tax=Halobacteriovorax marinus TaxID=97084 RepID=UPI000BC2E047|nr:hypothetical protein [Halobacteriovorax marinus]ATH08419.1 hypothetical protein BIY24_10800 [Halobacteriovorax marinus]
MKKLLTLTALGLVFASCSSNEMASNSHALAERNVASVNTPICAVEQHSRNKSWYRVSIAGKPHNEHWYGKKQVMRIKNNYVQKGKCQ